MKTLVPYMCYIYKNMCIYIFPHNFVWGSCFWFCIPSLLLLLRPPVSAYHTITSHTHKLSTQLCHKLSVTYINLTHNFVTYHLSHWHIHTLNTQLCHIPSVTYMTSHTPSSHTILHIVLHIHDFTHTPSSHTILHIVTHTITSHTQT